MKKIVMTAVALASAATMVQAQVTSANIVGYSKVVNQSGIQIMSVQFDSGDSTLTGIFGDTLPEGSKVYKYVNGTYDGNIATYGPVFMVGNTWTPDLTIEQGSSFWVETSATVTNIISGEVDLSAAVTNNIVPGLQMLSFPYPVERTIDQLGITPTEGDKIYKFVDGSYDGNISTYGEVFLSGYAWKPSLTFGVGEGFWYQSNAVTTNEWVAEKPF